MSEELIVNKKAPKKALGRGLGSLLGEVAAANEEVGRAPATATQLNTNVTEAKEALPNKQVAARPDVSTEQNQLSKDNIKTTNTVEPGAQSDRIWRIGIEKIFPNKEQPRKQFLQEKLAELALSIKEKGILLPIIVRAVSPEKYEIVAGERRWRAAQQAGLHEVPVIIKKAENQEALELAIIENVQRQDINPVEEAEAYGILASRYKLTQQQIAEKVGKDRSTVANIMRLAALTAEVKAMMKAGDLQIGQAKVLLSIPDPNLQTQLAKKVVRQKLSVRATEKLVARAKENENIALDIDEAAINERDLQPLISELQKLLGTRVGIEASGQRSKVTINFYSLPELNQFVDTLRKGKL